MIAVDHLTAAVMDALSSGYCPTSKTNFLVSLFAAFAVFCGIGFGLIVAASRSMNSTRRFVVYIGAAVLLLFALGGAGWDVFGLSGCGSHATAGVTWDWPW